jgi:hypothetical protein
MSLYICTYIHTCACKCWNESLNFVTKNEDRLGTENMCMHADVSVWVYMYVRVCMYACVDVCIWCMCICMGICLDFFSPSSMSWICILFRAMLVHIYSVCMEFQYQVLCILHGAMHKHNNISSLSITNYAYQHHTGHYLCITNRAYNHFSYGRFLGVHNTNTSHA